MLTSSMLQHSFDINVGVWAVCNLLAANWVRDRATAFARSNLGLYGRAVWAIGLKFSVFVKNRLGYKMTLTAIFLQFSLCI